MGKEKIRALKIEPMKHPKVCYIESSVKAFWRAVNADNINDGGIEAKRLERKVYAVFNKDRFLAHLEANRRIGDDIIAGTILIVETNDDKLPISITDSQLSKYLLRFWNTECFDDVDIVEANLNTMFARFLKDEEL